jgi:hypothetical protein
MYIIAVSKISDSLNDKIFISCYDEFKKVCNNTEVYDYFLYNSNDELLDQLITY